MSQNSIIFLGDDVCLSDLPMVKWLFENSGVIFASRCALRWGDFISKKMRKVKCSNHVGYLFSSKRVNIKVWQNKKDIHLWWPLARVRFSC